MKNKIIKLFMVFIVMLTLVMTVGTLQAKDKKEVAPAAPQQALPKTETKIKKVSKPAPKKTEVAAKADDNLLKNIETLSQQVVNQVTAKNVDVTNDPGTEIDEEPIVLEDNKVAPVIAATKTEENVLTPLDVMKDKNRVLGSVQPNILDAKVSESLPWSKTLTITAFMLCSLVSLAFVYSRKFGKKIVGNQSLGKQMKLIQTLSLGYKKSVALVEWNKKLVMLGVSENNVNFVSMSDSPETEKVESVETKTSFHDLLASETLLADSVKVNLTNTNILESLNKKTNQTSPETKNSPLAERIKGKIGALKSTGFKPLPIHDLSAPALKSRPSTQTNSFVVDYSPEKGFLKE